jgi:hypothetical protein
MTEGLLRQRRNLMIVSILMVFIKFSEFKVKKLTISGLSFEELGNPSSIYVMIWVLFFYFLFRYHQYYAQEGKGSLFSQIDASLGTKIQNYSAEVTQKINEHASYTPNNLDSIKRKAWSITVRIPDHKSPGNDEMHEVILNPFVILKFKLACWFNACVNNSVVTDYLFPYFIAGFTLYYCYDGSGFSLLNSLSAF